MNKFTESDAIDHISAKLSTVLLNNQELDFSRLRGLALLNGDSDNKDTYYELIILSFIKYLKLSSTFQLEIRQEVSAYKIFNAMNLNDDTINAHFVIFLSLVAPDIINALCLIASRLASDLAKHNSTRYTAERVEILEERINSLTIEGNKRGDVELKIAPNANVHSRQNIISHSNQRVSLLEALVPSPKRRNTSGQYIRNRKTKTLSSHSSGSNENYSLDRYINSTTLNSQAINKRIRTPIQEETAYDTASRIYSKSNGSVVLDPVIPSDSISMVLPTKDQINKAKAKYSIVQAESSVDF
jgi:hypothetical protein